MQMPSHQQPSWASSDKAAGLPMQENHDCSRVAHHALVLGHSGHVKADPNQPNLLTQPFNQTPDRNLTNLSLHAWLLEPAIKEQGFYDAVAVRIKTPQRGSIRSVYEAKWTILQSGSSVIRSTSGHPTLKSIVTSYCTCSRTGSYS